MNREQNHVTHTYVQWIAKDLGRTLEHAVQNAEMVNKHKCSKRLS